MSKSILMIVKMDKTKRSIIEKILNRGDSVVVVDEMNSEYYEDSFYLNDSFSLCAPFKDQKFENAFVHGPYSLDYVGDLSFDEIVWIGEGHQNLKKEIELFSQKKNINILYC